MLLLLGAVPAVAGTVGLTWSPSLGATGYRVYRGTSPDRLVDSVDVGDVTRTTLSTLPDCATSYFAVTAYNAAGESAFSEIVSTWPRPSVDLVSPGSAQQGARFTLTVRGINFAPGATLESGNPDVLLGPPSVSCDGITVAVTVEPTAPDVRPARVGSYTLEIRNPGGLLASRSLEVLIDAARFDVNRSDATTDGRLDGKDTVWLARLFGSAEGDATYDPDFDFNGDGWVDGEELSLLSSRLGACWTGTTWDADACTARRADGASP